MFRFISERERIWEEGSLHVLACGHYFCFPVLDSVLRGETRFLLAMVCVNGGSLSFSRKCRVLASGSPPLSLPPLPHPSSVSHAFQVGLGPVSGTHSAASEDLVPESQDEMEEDGKKGRGPILMGRTSSLGLLGGRKDLWASRQ